MTRDQLILEWDKAKKELARIKDLEMSLRLQVVETEFPEHTTDGTENSDLGGGYKLKAKFGINYSFSDREALDNALSAIEKMSPEGEYIAERLVKYDPKLSVAEYKKLDEQYRRIIDKVIVTKYATPTLELVIPKDI